MARSGSERVARPAIGGRSVPSKGLSGAGANSVFHSVEADQARPCTREAGGGPSDSRTRHAAGGGRNPPSQTIGGVPRSRLTPKTSRPRFFIPRENSRTPNSGAQHAEICW